MQTRIENGAGPRFTGLGVWNVYFIIAFALAAFGYIELNLLGNALLMAWLLLPVGPKWLRILRGTLGVAAAAVLLYSESWLPGVDSILANKGGIAGFSLLYMAEFALDFINVKMVGWGLLPRAPLRARDVLHDRLLPRRSDDAVGAVDPARTRARRDGRRRRSDE